MVAEILTTRIWVMQKVNQHKNILTNASSMIATTFITSGLGFVYWWAAAQSFSQSSVGVASTAISTMLLLGTIGMLGFGTLIMGELSVAENIGTLIATALWSVAIFGIFLGSSFAILAPILSTELSVLGQHISTIILYGLGVSLSAVTFVLDQILIGLLRGELQLLRNGLFTSTKLGLLVLVGLLTLKSEVASIAIFATWTAGNLISITVIVLLARRAGVSFQQRFDRHILSNLKYTVLAHHLLNIALQTPTFVLPLIVTIALSPEKSASWYFAWMIASFVFLVPSHLSTVLYAVDSKNPSFSLDNMRFTMGGAALVGVAACIVLVVGADPILSLFGKVYADDATLTLKILVFGIFPLIIKYHYIALHRIQRQVRKALLPLTLGSLLEVGAAIFGAVSNGLPTLAVAWLIAVTIEALFFAPSILRCMGRKTHLLEYTPPETA